MGLPPAARAGRAAGKPGSGMSAMGLFRRGAKHARQRTEDLDMDLTMRWLHLVEEPRRRRVAGRAPAPAALGWALGMDPYAAPLPQDIRERIEGRARPVPPRRGSRHTVPFAHDFDQRANRSRPYAPQPVARQPYRLPDNWRRQTLPTQQGQSLARFVRDRMRDLEYPAPGAQPSEVAAFMARVDIITGTRSTFTRPARCIAWARGITGGAA